MKNFRAFPFYTREMPWDFENFPSFPFIWTLGLGKIPREARRQESKEIQQDLYFLAWPKNTAPHLHQNIPKRRELFCYTVFIIARSFWIQLQAFPFWNLTDVHKSYAF